MLFFFLSGLLFSIIIVPHIHKRLIIFFLVFSVQSIFLQSSFSFFVELFNTLFQLTFSLVYQDPCIKEKKNGLIANTQLSKLILLLFQALSILLTLYCRKNDGLKQTIGTIYLLVMFISLRQKKNMLPQNALSVQFFWEAHRSIYIFFFIRLFVYAQ